MSALAKELAGIDLGDLRLNRRARRVLQTLDEKPMLSIPSACGDWDETHAAYRLFDHAEVSAEKVLATHRARTVERIGAHPRVLCLEDTSAFDYTGKGAIQGLGPLNDGTRRGLYPHPTLAVTPDRLALGLLHAHSWSREPGSLAQSRDASRPPENKESVRWINGYQRINELAEQLPDTRLTYIADPEGDIHDLFIKASCPESCADRLVRGKHDRVLGNGETLRQRLTKAPVLTETSFEHPATNGRAGRTVHQ